MIHNDKSHGSLSIFTDDELKTLNAICYVAEEELYRLMPEPTPYKLNETRANTDIWLVPESDFLTHINKWCENAKAVYDEWDTILTKELEVKKHRYEFPLGAEIDAPFTPTLANRPKMHIYDNCDLYGGNIMWLDHEHMTLEKIKHIILNPWIQGINDPDTCLKYFPWGWFDGQSIFICLDYIKKVCRNDSSWVLHHSAAVLLQQLAHAMMYNEECGPEIINKSPLLFWIEETMAVKIMLNYIRVYDNEFFEGALSYVKNRTVPYNLGISLYHNNVGDWMVYKSQKNVVDRKDGIEFLKTLCLLQFRRTYPSQLNEAFYHMMNLYTLMDNWAEKAIKDYGIIEYNDGMRTSITTVRNWRDVYLRLTQLLELYFPSKVLIDALPPIETGTKVSTYKTGKGLVINLYGSELQIQERIKQFMDHLFLPYANVRIYIKG